MAQCEIAAVQGQMLANIQSQAEQVVDARGAAYAGTAPEPRGMQPGHIPGALNLPYTQLYNADGTFKDKAGIRAAFEDAGVDLSAPSSPVAAAASRPAC
jgi:thiosulfate/3-mercaptopyruvate sulfurtransferase